MKAFHLIAADAATRVHQLHARAPELLRVSFVRVLGGTVEGVLEPYILPECNCPATTVFQGLVRGDSIVGDYVTRAEFGIRVNGTWRARRKPGL